MGSDTGPEIACTLGAGDVTQRLANWQAALALVTGRQPIDGGVRLSLPPDASLGALADLAVAEQQCCTFFAFAVTVDDWGAALEVTAPPKAAEVVRAVFGTAPAG